MLPVLSHYQAGPLRAARMAGAERVPVSLDLGLSEVTATLTAVGVQLPDGQVVTWAQLDEMCDNALACFSVSNGRIEKIQFYSEAFDRFYSLMPTGRAPTMLISGIPMHRVKDTDPYRDTLSKIRAAQPTGRVLDTTMGLGYTAVEATKTADSVLTIELDPTVAQICRLNPWSQGLFDNPKITRVIGDAFDVVEGLGGEQFSCVIHDPPMFSLAGDLYSSAFYRELCRVLKSRGRLFHYIGDPKSKSGSSVTRGVGRRLQEAGFARVKPAPQAFGVVAFK
jgi:hypothetical protein